MITNETDLKNAMMHIDKLFNETDENTPADDPRLIELDVVSKMVEEYEGTYLGLNHDYLKECAEQAMATPQRPLSLEEMKAQVERIHRQAMEDEA